MEMAPRSTKKLPAAALSSVDFPEPFVPITVTNEPSSIRSDTPRSARTSFGVSAKNVFCNSRSCSMSSHLLHRRRQHQRAEDKDRRHELEVVRVQAPAQGHRDDQSEEDRAHDRAGQSGSYAVRSHESPADHDAGHSPHD